MAKRNLPAAVNRDKPDQWKADVAASVDMYNAWFLRFAPKAFREKRVQATHDVKAALMATRNLTDVRPGLIQSHPEVLPTLRMSTCPPLAVDRLIGLANVSSTLVKTIEKHKRMPPRMAEKTLVVELSKVADIIERMADPDVFVWLKRTAAPTRAEIHRAATIVADRLCSSFANPTIRNAQERRQIDLIADWLGKRGYTRIVAAERTKFSAMNPGTFGIHMNVPVTLQDRAMSINITVDVVIMPKSAKPGSLPIFFEAKSAGDFTNTNKRRKEEAKKITQLRSTYGKGVSFNLFLCGYFDSGYLGYAASDGIDWVWEHRIDDFAQFGI